MTARPERKDRPLGPPVAYRLATAEPGLKQMLTVRRPSFRWSLKLRLPIHLSMLGVPLPKRVFAPQKRTNTEGCSVKTGSAPRIAVPYTPRIVRCPHLNTKIPLFDPSVCGTGKRGTPNMLNRLYHIKSASLKLANSKEERDTSECATSGEASAECVVALYHSPPGGLTMPSPLVNILENINQRGGMYETRKELSNCIPSH